ncbi:unnamed protein product [Ascophyllum nodosum]
MMPKHLSTSWPTKPTTDTEYVSKSLLAKANRPDPEPSDSRLPSFTQTPVNSQVSRSSSLLVSLCGKFGPVVAKPTGNDDRAPAGMTKKWQQHFAHGKWIQLGNISVQISCVLFLVMCILWSQLLYPQALNSKTLFEAIIDGKDQVASNPSYIRWLAGLFSDEKELTAGYALHSFYVWHVTNPSEILEQGFKPKLEETGPFGYKKRTTKYDALFSANDSAKVTYRSWTVYQPTEHSEDCKNMFFRMDKARLRPGIPDCIGIACNCVDDSREVTVVNPPFLKLLQRYKPTGLLSTLAQEVFADIKEGMTVGFVRATKAYLLPAVLSDVYQFRKAFLTADKVLGSIFSSLSANSGTTTAVSALCGDYHSVTIDCQGFQPRGYSTSCPWGLLSYIENAASSLGVRGTISETEAEFLVGHRSSTNGSIFDGGRGTLAWIAAGRYGGYLAAPSMPHPEDTDATGEIAFNERVTTVCTWEPLAGGHASTLAECKAKVVGILNWLFGVWFTEENQLDGLVVEEWRGASSDRGKIVCDVAGGLCPWGVNSGTGSIDWNISVPAAARMINPAKEDARNDLSLYTLDGQTLWTRAYTFCTMGSSLECDGAYHYLEAANTTLPALLRLADSGSQGWRIYVEQVCEVATNIFGSWVRDSKWLDHVVINYLSDSVQDLTGYHLNGENVEDIGYVQWATGAISLTLLEQRSLSTIVRGGIMEFMDESLHALGPELWTQVAIAGYPNMGNLTVPSGRALLDVLAMDSDEADEFRRFILRQSTTYHGNADGWWHGSSSSTASSDSTDVLFIEENPYGNFSSLAWEGSMLNSSLVHAMSWLDTSFMSSSSQCYVLEELYERCLALVADGRDWPSNCAFFQTIISNPSKGIECDDERIYENTHPYPKKPGNVLATFIHKLAWEEVLKKEHLVCHDQKDCDFSRGGYFTTKRARDVVFGGYTDPLNIKLMNKRLAARNLEIRCSVQHIVATDMYCRPLYDGDCTDTGFEVIHDVYGIVLEVNRSGPSRYLWHSAELTLPYDLGTIENPVFAVHPGGNWDNETFQKTADCDKRTLQGDANLWNSCNTTVHTGAFDPGKIGSTILYHGNDSLLAADGTESRLEIYGTDGTQDTPRQWEGFGEYKLMYRLRNTGLERFGNDSVVILKGQYLLQLHMARDSSDAALQYPTRYLAGENVTLEIDIRLNRYITQAQGWLDARKRVGNNVLRDFNGMNYLVPMGMVSTQLLTGYGTFISDPHFLTNHLLDQQAAEQMNYIAPDETLHQSFVDVEPVSGKVLRRAIRLQLLFRVERSAFSPNLMSSESSSIVCRSPTKDTFADGPGCFMYVPILWFEDQRVMDPASAGTLQEEILFYPNFVVETAWKGLIASTTLAVFGGVLWARFMLLKTKHDRRVWVD